ncbi:MAG: hypothetical protein IKQ98_04010 [Erysipelotrichaceae bacterium]|nr:hypothetical protein [Erysipelotrichaceae bacterium]
MANMQSLLEKDKERFLHNAAAVKSSAETVRFVEEEFGRLLTLYNEEEENESLKKTAMFMTEAYKASAGFLDCDGESVIWSKSQYRPGVNKPKRSAWGIALFLLGLGCLIGAGAVLYLLTDIFPLSDEKIIAFSLIGAAVLFFFISGLLFFKKKEENKEELYAETIPSPEKTYHIMLNCALQMDRVLEEERNRILLKEKKALLDEKEGMKKEDVQLYSSLLETAYAQTEEEYARQMISDLRFYLHRHKIDVIDYDGSNKQLFERMPGAAIATIRPALLIGDEVLRKGLATGE